MSLSCVRSTPVIALAAALFAPAVSAVYVIDTGTAATPTSVISLRNSFSPFNNVAAQSFTVPTAAGTNLLFDTFDIELDGSVRNQGRFFGAEVRGYLAAFNPLDNGFTIVGVDPAVEIAPRVVSTNDTAEFETYSFAPRDSAGNRVLLAPLGRYGIVLTGGLNSSISGAEGFFVGVASANGVATDPVEADGRAFSFRLPSADLMSGQIVSGADVGTGSFNTDLLTTIVLVPEPGTITLLAAGGLLMLRRRAA